MATNNRKARFNYEITDTYEVGIVLTGPEVKSVRAGQINLDESYAKFIDGELWLVGAHIAPYKQAMDEQQSPIRKRKLLMNKKELEKLELKIQTEGLTLVPLKTYLKQNKLKLELGLARGKRKYDKRATLKSRDQEREIRRKLK